MATVTTYDLIKCNRIYPTLPSINSGTFSALNGLIVKLDNDPSKAYTVRKNVQARFYHPSDYLTLATVNPLFSVSYNVTSMKLNGVEKLTAPYNTFINAANLEFTAFPYYTFGNFYTYTNNVANGVITAVDPAGTLSFGTNNFYKFIETVINSVDLPVKISKSPPNWFSPEGKPNMVNFILEKYFDDDFEFTVVETTSNFSGPSTVTKTHKFQFNGLLPKHFINGVDVVSTAPLNQQPQFSEVNSFLSYQLTFSSTDVIPSCPIFDPFATSLDTGGCSSISVSCECDKITFADTSNYLTNGLPGHDPELFTSRTITLTKANGGTYTWSTDAGADQTINPHYLSSNQFSYNFTDNDIDGVYEVTICSYPDWSNAVFYEAFTQTIVRRNGKLYKVISSNTNVDPTSSPAYWAEYTCDDDCTNTRYCTTSKILVICISLLRCYKTLVKDAFCSIEENPCKNICENTKFVKAMKFRVTLDALEFAVCANNWIEVEKHVDILNSICCCND
jgi:hypothetical protein